MSHIYYRLNDEAWSLYTSSITIMQDGNYTLYFYSVDAVGNAEAIGSVEFSIDTTAPVTEISCDGSGGANGWFTSRIYFYAVISDELSGANRTYCRIDGGAWHLMDGSDMCSTDGTHTIEYYSIDAAGNVEAVRTAVFKIDGSAPTITLDRKDGDSITSSGLVLKVNGSDAVSGVDQLLISIGRRGVHDLFSQPGHLRALGWIAHHHGEVRRQRREHRHEDADHPRRHEPAQPERTVRDTAPAHHNPGHHRPGRRYRGAHPPEEVTGKTI